MTFVADYKLPDALIEKLKNQFSNVEITENQDFFVPLESVVPFMAAIKENPDIAMDFLTSLTASDYPDRFEMIYHLVSLNHCYTMTVKTKVLDKESPQVPSLCPLWGGAHWQEREVYDLFGIVFTGYPDHPTRIFLDDDFEGYPLRKDFQWVSGRES